MSTTQYLDELKERLHKHKTTDVARKSGVDVSTVRRIRNGINTNPSLDTATRLHQALEELDSYVERRRALQARMGKYSPSIIADESRLPINVVRTARQGKHAPSESNMTRLNEALDALDASDWGAK